LKKFKSMKSILSIIAAMLLTVGSKGQGIFANGPEHPTIEAGAGLILQDIGYRFTLGGKDLFLNNRLGVYYTAEYRSAQESEAVYQRNIVGLTYSLNKNWAFRAGVGLFGKGSLLDSDDGLRKELTVTYQPNKLPVSFDVGYSFGVGPTTTVRYIIPLGGNQKVEAPKPVEEEVETPTEEEITPVEEEIVTPTEEEITPVEEEIVTPTEEEITPVEEEIVTPTEEEVTPVEEEVVTPTEEEITPVEEVKPSPSQELLSMVKEISLYKYNLDEASPGEKMKGDLNKIADYLKSNSTASLSIVGHSCGIGGEAAKLKISKARAEQVANVLKSAGVNADQLEVSWKSDAEKIGVGQVNRRVSITLK
jgi:outer membrane protein OmpA-like peptidoglycan-associated protein